LPDWLLIDLLLLNCSQDDDGLLALVCNAPVDDALRLHFRFRSHPLHFRFRFDSLQQGLLHAVRHLGVNVMMTNFSDFRQFSAKPLAFLLKTNVTYVCMIQCVVKLAVFLVKNANFPRPGGVA
jgi:hypothetical protein